MLIRIDTRSGLPIFLQIAAAIEGQIEAGALVPGDRLPPARSLAASLEVNMHTVLKAYAYLQEHSLVELRRGRGGAVVSGVPDVGRLARGLVSAARKSGMSREALVQVVSETWR